MYKYVVLFFVFVSLVYLMNIDYVYLDIFFYVVNKKLVVFERCGRNFFVNCFYGIFFIVNK